LAEKTIESRKRKRKSPKSKKASTDQTIPAENVNDIPRPTEKRVAVEELIVEPELPKARVFVIKPSSMQEEESIKGRATEIVESVKDKTDEAIGTIVSNAGLGDSRIESLDARSLIIPIIEQKGSVETKGLAEGIVIEKRQVQRKKTIEVSVNHDEVFVNDKHLGTSLADTIKDIKEKILDIVTFEPDRHEKELEKIGGEKVPLLGDNTEMSMVLPLYAEQIIISKRLVKIADLTIHKRKVTETRKVDIDDVTEELTIQNPTGSRVK
jgi:stress response protein YsnF